MSDESDKVEESIKNSMEQEADSDEGTVEDSESESNPDWYEYPEQNLHNCSGHDGIVVHEDESDKEVDVPDKDFRNTNEDLDRYYLML